jgi:hypothetical protein
VQLLSSHTEDQHRGSSLFNSLAILAVIRVEICDSAHSDCLQDEQIPRRQQDSEVFRVGFGVETSSGRRDKPDPRGNLLAETARACRTTAQWAADFCHCRPSIQQYSTTTLMALDGKRVRKEERMEGCLPKSRSGKDQRSQFGSAVACTPLLED